jgi:RNA polymerase sigma-70 factor (ECF subfamily)
VRDRTKSDAAQEAGFERLFQEHWGRVVGVLFRLVGDPDEAEDLALETFWRLHCRPPAELEALNGEPVPAEQRLGGWLYRVATRLGYNALRARRRRQRYEEEAGRLALEEDRPPTPDQALELAEQRQCVQRILAELPPRQAQVLVLRHSGLSYSEIAAALGVAAGSVGTLLARAERAFEQRWMQRCSAGALKMHLSEGELRHGWMAAAGGPRQAHLQDCPACQGQTEALRGRAGLVSAQLDALAPQGTEKSRPARSARRQLDVYEQRKEQESMFEKLFARRFRPAWVTAGVVVILAVALAFPQVRALAVDFLGLFRVQQVTVVQVDADSLSERLGSSQQLEQLFTEDVQVDVQGESQTASSAAQASELAGIGAPANGVGQPQFLNVEPAASMVFTVDVEQLETVLQELGQTGLDLPAALDGAEVTATQPPLVLAGFGECVADAALVVPEGYDPDEPGTWSIPQCTTLAQMASPSVEAPAGLDLAQIGQIYLQILGMTPEEAQRFSENVDWATTLVIPMPMGGAEYQDVSVDGVTGTLILFNGPGKDYMLIWVKDGIVYALQGPGSAADALKIANSLK